MQPGFITSFACVTVLTENPPDRLFFFPGGVFGCDNGFLQASNAPL